MLSWPSFWNHVPEEDRPALRQCASELLKSGCIIGDQGAARELYLVARDQYLRELMDYFSVLNIELLSEPEHAILQARPIPGECDLVANFTKEETLLVLSLWRLYDEAHSERPAAAVVITVNDLWHKLRVFFDKIEPPTETHLEKMLSKLRRKRLIRFQRQQEADRFGDSLVEILPTLVRVIPFENIETWKAQADLYTPRSDLAQP